MDQTCIIQIENMIFLLDLCLNFVSCAASKLIHDENYSMHLYEKLHFWPALSIKFLYSPPFFTQNIL